MNQTLLDYNELSKSNYEDKMKTIDIVVQVQSRRSLFMCHTRACGIVFKVSIHLVAAENARFVQLLDLKFYDFSKFLKEYSSDANAYLASAGAAGGIVSTDKLVKVKGLWDPSYIIMNFWESPEKFEAAYTSGLSRCVQH